MTPEAPGLGELIADIVRGNIAADARRADLLDGMRGRINITATDAGVTTGLLFTGSALNVGSAFDRADVWVEGDADTLMELSSVPLRFGTPDPLSAGGRAVLGKVATGKLKIKGLPMHARLLTRFQRLLSVR
jgi:hypothetical protein